MKLRLDLVFAAILVATAGSELVAPDAHSAPQALEQEQAREAKACRADAGDGATRIEAAERIIAYGYSDITELSKGCGDTWHAVAFAEGDPVSVVVTPDGKVLTE
jgi:hypothetical protein